MPDQSSTQTFELIKRRVHLIKPKMSDAELTHLLGYATSVKLYQFFGMDTGLRNAVKAARKPSHICHGYTFKWSFAYLELIPHFCQQHGLDPLEVALILVRY